jgi:hypothetical protein
MTTKKGGMLPKALSHHHDSCKTHHACSLIITCCIGINVSKPKAFGFGLSKSFCGLFQVCSYLTSSFSHAPFASLWMALSLHTTFFCSKTLICTSFFLNQTQLSSQPSFLHKFCSMHVCITQKSLPKLLRTSYIRA